jgi:hypothetical protein
MNWTTSAGEIFFHVNRRYRFVRPDFGRLLSVGP